MHRRNLGNVMIDPAVLHANRTREAPRGAWYRQRWLWITGLLAVATVLVSVLVLWEATHRAPGDDSVEAGFARDMIVHHDQAVTMALSIRDRTTDPAIKTLATDILLTQENQIGQMLGWLTIWGLPATGSQPLMAWMGHAATAPMPGMATPEELANLERLSGSAADAEFLRLMIQHHRGAIPMAEAALERSGNTQVRTFARSIIAAQSADIAAMEDLLRRDEIPKT
jgi:uncharacterized protein (DUF305 family)